MPEFVKKFIVDFIETGLAALAGLTIAFPTTWEDLRVVGISIGVALLGAAISAARRAAPDFIDYIKSKLGVTPPPPAP